MALKFTVHGVQSFIKGHRKSGVISIKHSRDITNRINPLRVRFLPVTATYIVVSIAPFLQSYNYSRLSIYSSLKLDNRVLPVPLTQGLLVTFHKVR